MHSNTAWSSKGQFVRLLLTAACLVLLPACSSSAGSHLGAGGLGEVAGAMVGVGGTGDGSHAGSGGQTLDGAADGGTAIGPGGQAGTGWEAGHGGLTVVAGGSGSGGQAGNGSAMGIGGRNRSGGTTNSSGGQNGTGGATISGGNVPCAGSLTAQAITADVAMPPGANYAVASFRLWYPQGVDKVRGILLLVPGSNLDGRAAVTSTAWQKFANAEKLALIGCSFADYQAVSDEQYAQAVLGSGQATLDAITKFSTQTGRCELASAPLLLWGFSAGGQFTYDFTCFAPDRVIAFVVNKGGYYHPVPATPGAMKVPGLMFIGGRDLQRRIDAINTVFAAGRTLVAPWALSVERTMEHAQGDSINLSLPFFHAILPMRLPPDGVGPLLDIDQSKGYIGDLDALKFSPSGPQTPANLVRTAWLPDQATATLWQTVVNK